MSWCFTFPPPSHETEGTWREKLLYFQKLHKEREAEKKREKELKRKLRKEKKYRNGNTLSHSRSENEQKLSKANSYEAKQLETRDLTKEHEQPTNCDGLSYLSDATRGKRKRQRETSEKGLESLPKNKTSSRRSGEIEMEAQAYKALILDWSPPLRIKYEIKIYDFEGFLLKKQPNKNEPAKRSEVRNEVSCSRTSEFQIYALPYVVPF